MRRFSRIDEAVQFAYILNQTLHFMVSVFAFYFIVTLIVTLGHMKAEYNNSKNEILNDLVIFQKTVEPGIEEALKQLKTITNALDSSLNS